MLSAVCRRALAALAVTALAAGVVVGSAAPAGAADPDGPSFTNPHLASVTPTSVVGVHTIYRFTATVQNRNMKDTDDLEFTFPSGTAPDLAQVGDLTSDAPDQSDCFFQPSTDPSYYQAACGGVSARIGDKLEFDFGIYSTQVGIYSWSESTCVGCPAASGYETDSATSSVWTVVGAQPVSQPSVVVTPTHAAGASEVTYDVGFTTSGRGVLATGQLGAVNPYTADSSVSITFGQGTFFDDFAAQPPDGPNGAWAWQPCVEHTYTVVCTLAHGVVPAHTHLVIPITGMVNPAAASHRITISTSTDTVAVNTPKYTTVPAHAVVSPTLTLGPSNAVGANDELTVGFTTSTTGGLGPGSTTSVSLPGTDDNRDVSGRLTVRGTTVGSCGGSTPDIGCGLSRSVAAGDPVVMELDGVTYETVGTHPVTISTTSDIKPVTANVKVNAARPVSAPVITNLSDTPSGRTDYQVAFTTSSQGGMSAGPNSAARVFFPPGTVFGYRELVPTGTLVDVSTGQTIATCDFDQPDLAEYCSDFAHPTAAGDHLVVHANGLTNPGAGVYEISVTTSSDSATATSLQYLITGSVTGVTVTVTPSAVTGGRSHYLVRFGTSRTGELTGAANDFVLMQFPSGTGLGGDFSDSTVTNPEGTIVGTCQEFASPFVACGMVPGADVDGGDTLSVNLSGVINPPPGTYTVAVSTSEDQDFVNSSAYTIGAASAVSAVTAALGPAVAAGARSDYALTLTTSATGALAPSAHSTVTAQFPSGTGLGTLTSATVVETSSGTPVGSCPATNGTLLTCTIGTDVDAGTALTILVDGVVNPPAGAHTVGVGTSSDPQALTTAAFSTSVPDGVSDATVTVSGAKHGQPGTYTVAFVPSGGGAMGPNEGATISLTLPAGSYPDQVTTAKILDAGEKAGGPCSVSGLTITCTITGEVSPGDLVTMTVKPIVNPPAGSYTMTVSTSSDPVPETTSSYTIH